MKRHYLREVVEAKYLREYEVELVFDDLTRGVVNLHPFLNKGIFRPLLNKKRFRQFRADAELGTICWPNGADIAPETLYLLAHKKLVAA